MNKNPFANVDVNKAKIPLQEKKDGKIIKKKAGRPKRPNMQSYLIKMDKALHKQISDFAHKTNINKSAAISMAIKDFFNKNSDENNNNSGCIKCQNNTNPIEGFYILKRVDKKID